MNSELVVVLAVALSVAAAASGGEDRATVRPKDTGAALENPGMGWVFHYYDNVPAHYGSRLAPSDTLDDYPGLTVIYLRIPWSYIEPEEGKFHWAVLDTPAERWIAKGKRVAFRITCSESWKRWATPEWVHKAGAKGHNFRPGKGVVKDGPFWEPDFDDPVFLDKLDHFLAAMATRYDGSPEVAFVDVGSLGVWGEGHTGASTRIKYPAAVVRKHIALHAKHFKRTLLAVNDDFVVHGGGQANIDYARERGLTLRDDSILVQGGQRAYFHAAMAQPFWPKVPVILESEHYGGSKARGNWQDGRLYLKAVEDYHASYASIHWWPREFLRENRELVRRINLRLGYRLQLVEASWPKRLRRGASFRFAARWRNAGVAPCLPGGFPALTLKDEKGGIAGVFVDDGFNARNLPVAPPGKAEARKQEREFALPFQLMGGTYSVFVSVGTRTGAPRIALPMADGDGRRRYRIGTMRVLGDYAVRVGELERKGEKWLLPLTWTVHEPLPENVQPFCHFCRSGIKFYGHAEDEEERRKLEQPGTVAIGCVFAVPDGARGQAFDVKVGLWVPKRIGRPNERMVSDHGEPDRRVLVGQLKVDGDGTVTFVRAGSD